MRWSWRTTPKSNRLFSGNGRPESGIFPPAGLVLSRRKAPPGLRSRSLFIRHIASSADRRSRRSRCRRTDRKSRSRPPGRSRGKRAAPSRPPERNAGPRQLRPSAAHGQCACPSVISSGERSQSTRFRLFIRPIPFGGECQSQYSPSTTSTQTFSPLSAWPAYSQCTRSRECDSDTPFCLKKHQYLPGSSLSSSRYGSIMRPISASGTASPLTRSSSGASQWIRSSERRSQIRQFALPYFSPFSRQ